VFDDIPLRRDVVFLARQIVEEISIIRKNSQVESVM
jgi:hypothetical protein